MGEFWQAKASSKYRLVFYSLLAVVLGPLSLWLLKRFLAGDTLLVSLEVIRPLPLVGALALLLVAWLSRLIRVGCLFRPMAKQITHARFVRSYLAGVFASQITPSAAGGYPLFLFLLYRQGMPPGSSLALSLLDSANTGLAFLGLLTSGALLFRTYIPITESWMHTGLVGMGLITAAALAPLLYPQALQQLAHLLSEKKHGLGGKLAPIAARAEEELERLRWVTLHFWHNHRSLLIINLLLNLVYWATSLAVAPLLFLAVGGKAPWPMIVGSQIATQFAQYFIPTPGAAGGAEVTMALFMHTLLPEERLVLFLGLWRLYTYYLSLVVSSLSIPWALRLIKEGQQPTADIAGDAPEEAPQES